MVRFLRFLYSGQSDTRSKTQSFEETAHRLTCCSFFCLIQIENFINTSFEKSISPLHICNVLLYSSKIQIVFFLWLIKFHWLVSDSIGQHTHLVWEQSFRVGEIIVVAWFWVGALPSADICLAGLRLSLGARGASKWAMSRGRRILCGFHSYVAPHYRMILY